MRPTKLLSLLFFLPLFTACGGSASEADVYVEADDEETLEAPNEDNTDLYDVDLDDPYLIQQFEFLGMSPGMMLADFSAGLREGKLRTGEGDFDVYYIDGAEGEELGYLVPEPRDERLIGEITITSPMVVTEPGLRVGNTFAELQERLQGDLEVFGSEVEGRTYAISKGIWYRIDAGNWMQEVDQASIDPNAKVIEIVMPRI